ncbi:NotI family restriction endonuclease [Armatimonas sp.]|uniref:NotI family restriction endonuclease n=1 Tax=Armatimonas sp. TaxID=1872638 RepID=UPI0037506C6D
MPQHPLAEVFGFPTTNVSQDGSRHRTHRLCPFHNRVPNCTKTSAENPLGVCSVFDSSGRAVITCPVRFRENWQIITDAATFFFPPGTLWTTITEVALKDRDGKSAGNIDAILLAYDTVGRIIDYGALEIQAVYISGNVGVPFAHYMEAPEERGSFDWRGQRNYPRPDFLSSSRKRLAPQLIFKGGILHTWKRKMAVALDTTFFETLPSLEEVPPHEAELAWFVYALQHDPQEDCFRLTHQRTVYTLFETALLRITRSEAGDESLFLTQLQRELQRKLNETISENPL